MDSETAVFEGPAIDRIRHGPKRAFLAVYSQTGNVVKSARSARIQRTMHYHWLDTDPDYAAAFDEARRHLIDLLESEAIRRAHDGVEQYVIYGGEIIKDPEHPDRPLIVRKYSDSLLKFLMQAADPVRYRQNHTQVGDDGSERIAGRGREQVIQDEIASRQAALDALRSRGSGVN